MVRGGEDEAPGRVGTVGEGGIEELASDAASLVRRVDREATEDEDVAAAKSLGKSDHRAVVLGDDTATRIGVEDMGEAPAVDGEIVL
jgi:hypothetical protein